MKRFQRIMVIGCCGAGKSTLSRRIASITDLPVIHLDQHFWKPGWVESAKDEWTQKVKALAEQDEWIIDGNYSGTMDVRIDRADAIIYLDYPTWKCLWRVISRTFRYLGKVRPDMVKGCPERFDISFLHYVLIFNMTRRKSVMDKLKSSPVPETVFVIKDDRELYSLINGFKNS